MEEILIIMFYQELHGFVKPRHVFFLNWNIYTVYKEKNTVKINKKVYVYIFSKFLKNSEFARFWKCQKLEPVIQFW